MHGTQRAPAHKHNGFTLIEVTLALAIFSVVLVSLIGLCFNVITMNKNVEHRVNAMNLVNEQLSEMMAASGSRRAFDAVGDSPAKAFLLNMREKMKYLEETPGLPSDFPYRVTLDQSAGALVYEFMIPAPGRRRVGLTDPVADVMNSENREALARGVVVAYLREDAVPRQFLDWGGRRSTGEETPWPDGWFPMAGAGSTGTGDYTSLITSGSPDWEASTLQNLPLAVSVRYYDSAAQMEADPVIPPPDNLSDFGTSGIGASRVCLVASNRFAL